MRTEAIRGVLACGWKVAIGLSLALGLLPLISGMHSTRLFLSERAGTSEAQQLNELKLPWTLPAFRKLVDTLDEILPLDAALLCTPVGGADRSGKSRWFLFLANALYPRRVFVRQPRFASGTLMDYPRWIDYHFNVLDTEASGLDLGAVLRREEVRAKVVSAALERGVEWELLYELDPKRPFDHVVLRHNGVPVELVLEVEPGAGLDAEEVGR